MTASAEEWKNGESPTHVHCAEEHMYYLYICLCQFYLFSLELSAQLAVLLQKIVHLLIVLIHHLLPQVDVALALYWNSLNLRVVFPLFQLLCL